MNLAGQIYSDARQAGNIFASLDQQADIAPQFAQGVGSVPVGADAEGVVALNLQQVSDLIKDRSDVFVVYWHNANTIESNREGR